MRDSDESPDLGIFAILGEAWTHMLDRLATIVAVGFVIGFAALVVSGLLVGFDAIITSPLPTDEDGAPIATGVDALDLAVLTLAQMIAYGLTIGALVEVAQDARAGRRRSVADYLRAAPFGIVPIVVLTIVVTIAATIGFALLVLPGLWLYGVFAVFIPAIVIEQAGFRALGRSAELTKGYRWPIVGLFLVILAIAIVAAIVLGFLLAVPIGLLGAADGGPNVVTTLLAIAVDAFVNSLAYGFAAIVSVLLYDRLRILKEGGDPAGVPPAP